MKSLLLIVILICATALISYSPKATLKIGDAMPNDSTELTNIDDEKVTLKSESKENGLLVMFSCNTCPYVLKNQTRTNEICKLAAENGFGVIILNSNEDKRNDDDSKSAMKEYAKEQGYQWTYAIDENSVIADAFGANKTPECFLFDENAKLAYHGAIDDNPNDANNVTRQHLAIAITELKEKKEITVKESKSVGCSIKRKKA
jgi:thioredoxin-related protein